jgi:two-component sensor histidine kinase
MRLLDYTIRLLGVSETIHRWHSAISALEAERREKVARYAEQIAATLARAAVAFARLQHEPADARAERLAIRELGRISGYVEHIIRALDRHSRDPYQVIGRSLWEVFPGARETPLGQLFLETMERHEPVKSETPSVVISGRWLAYRLFPLGDGMGVVFRDVTDRKSAEQQRDLLIKELHHRVNNTLATVQAIAAQTFRNSGVASDARKTFEARLLNLSNAHTALTHENWASVALQDLIQATLRPHDVPPGERFSLSGPDMRVQPKCAVALSMALHELSTNAAKYGALSADGGHVSIDWSAAGGRFGLRWQERGGPAVSAPTRKGFGSIMIERVLAEQIGGSVDISYHTGGIVCTIDAPLQSVRDGDGT